MKNTLRKKRKAKKLTQSALSSKTDISRQTIILIEKNKRDPSLKSAFLIAKALDCKINEIFKEK